MAMLVCGKKVSAVARVFPTTKVGTLCSPHTQQLDGRNRPRDPAPKHADQTEKKLRIQIKHIQFREEGFRKAKQLEANASCLGEQWDNMRRTHVPEKVLENPNSLRRTQAARENSEVT